MTGLHRFFSIGLADADARVDSALARRSFADTDRYIASSGLVRFLDGATRRLQEWATASEAARLVRSLQDEWRRQSWRSRYEGIAAVLLTASAVHVVLSLLNGAPKGWFWLILPGLTAAFAVVVVAGSRGQASP